MVAKLNTFHGRIQYYIYIIPISYHFLNILVIYKIDQNLKINSMITIRLPNTTPPLNYTIDS